MNDTKKHRSHATDTGRYVVLEEAMPKPPNPSTLDDRSVEDHVDEYISIVNSEAPQGRGPVSGLVREDGKVRLAPGGATSESHPFTDRLGMVESSDYLACTDEERAARVIEVEQPTRDERAAFRSNAKELADRQERTAAQEKNVAIERVNLAVREKSEPIPMVPPPGPSPSLRRLRLMVISISVVDFFSVVVGVLDAHGVDPNNIGLGLRTMPGAVIVSLCIAAMAGAIGPWAGGQAIAFWWRALKHHLPHAFGPRVVILCGAPLGVLALLGFTLSCGAMRAIAGHSVDGFWGIFAAILFSVGAGVEGYARLKELDHSRHVDLHDEYLRAVAERRAPLTAAELLRDQAEAAENEVKAERQAMLDEAAQIVASWRERYTIDRDVAASWAALGLTNAQQFERDIRRHRANLAHAVSSARSTRR